MVLGGWRQKEHQFKVILSYRERSRPDWPLRLFSKTKQKLKAEADGGDSISDWPRRNSVLGEVKSACKDPGKGEEFKVF